MKLFTPKMRDFDRLGRSDPYPMHKLKRVERPTTRIDDALVQRVDERESGFNRAGRGDFGPKLKKEYFRFVNKHPLSSALLNMGFALRKQVDGEVAEGECLSYSPGGVCAAEDSFYPGEQFFERKWFCDVVVGAEVKAGNFFLFLSLGSEHYDWSLEALLSPFGT